MQKKKKVLARDKTRTNNKNRRQKLRAHFIANDKNRRQKIKSLANAMRRSMKRDLERDFAEGGWKKLCPI